MGLSPILIGKLTIACIHDRTPRCLFSSHDHLIIATFNQSQEHPITFTTPFDNLTYSTCVVCPSGRNPLRHRCGRILSLYFGISLGIFAYCSYLCEKDRRHICEVLCNGLARLEYRGYDSAGKHIVTQIRYQTHANFSSRCHSQVSVSMETTLTRPPSSSSRSARSPASAS